MSEKWMPLEYVEFKTPEDAKKMEEILNELTDDAADRILGEITRLREALYEIDRSLVVALRSTRPETVQHWIRTAQTEARNALNEETT